MKTKNRRRSKNVQDYRNGAPSKSFASKAVSAVSQGVSGLGDLASLAYNAAVGPSDFQGAMKKLGNTYRKSPISKSTPKKVKRK